MVILKQRVRAKPPIPCSHGTFGQLRCTKDDRITLQDTGDFTHQRDIFFCCRRRAALATGILKSIGEYAKRKSNPHPAACIVSSRRGEHFEIASNSQASARTTICEAQEHTVNAPGSAALSSPPKAPDKQPPVTRTQLKPLPAPPEGSPVQPCPPARHLQVQGVPMCTLSKSSRMRVLVPFLASRMKKSTRSCGRRAPRRAI